MATEMWCCEMRCCVRRLASVAGRILFLAAPMALGLPMLALAQESNTPGAPAAPAVTVPGTAEPIVPAVPASPSMVPVDLPRDLTPWGMYQTADPLVKAVLVGLVIASVITWTVWLSKSIE